MKILVLEPGAWGTALGIILSRKNRVGFWYQNPDFSSELSKFRENSRLPGIKIPRKISISSDLGKVIENTDLIIIASPSFNFRSSLLNLKKFRKLPPLLGIAKGIEKETLKLPSEVLEEIFGNYPYAHLSGPGFAKEIIRGKPAKELIASKDKKLLNWLKKLFQIRPLSISVTTDLIGVELAGALKNALSIGISLVEAASQSPEIGRIRPKLIKLGLAEMIKIGKDLGAKKETFLGPAGLGDLILTSTSPLSRNFQFGKAILLDAQKMRKEIRERKLTVEGFDNAAALYKIGERYKLDLPMLNEIYRVIYKKISPKRTVENLIKLTKLEE